MSNQFNQSAPKKQKSDFVTACNAVKMSIKGRLARAHVLSVFDFQNKGNPKHSTYLIVDPNDPKVQQLINIANQLKQQFYPHVPDLLWNHPVKDGRQPTRPNGDQWQEWQKGKLFIACSTGPDYPPTALVMDPNSPKGYRDATLLDERSVYYDGAEAVVEFGLGGMEGNNKGINLYFNAILGMGTGERIIIQSNGSFNASEAFAEFLGATAGNANMGNGNMGNGDIGQQSGNYATGAAQYSTPNQHGQTWGANASHSNQGQQQYGQQQGQYNANQGQQQYNNQQQQYHNQGQQQQYGQQQGQYNANQGQYHNPNQGQYGNGNNGGGLV